MSERLKLRVALLSSEKVNSLRLLGRSVKLGYCVLRIDSALMSEMLMRSEPERTSRSVDVVLKDRTEAELVAGRSSLVSPLKKGRHLIPVLGWGSALGGAGGGAGVAVVRRRSGQRGGKGSEEEGGRGWRQ